ncbi:unnamed protein product [Didymodactylos carnosus]|uniref:Helicase ATP-binding domain-containing protein n=1 Tax=Didymodactylos carnosus TaxID=1234261 RepID=A0A814PN55_9BILA|nr:unnamed protein product [Didymodactylos carnosus]CAF3872823.1 unnamed protein product [Didymodactylos carnosus]
MLHHSTGLQVDMPGRKPYTRLWNYSYRGAQLDINLTFDGISANPLLFKTSDPSVDDHHFALAELYRDNWNINELTKQLFIKVETKPTNPELVYHPLKWFYSLINTQKIEIYLTKHDRLYVTTSSKSYLNVFSFHSSCLAGDSTPFFRNLFSFNNYSNLKTEAKNVIDYIYREISMATHLDIEQTDVKSIEKDIINNNLIKHNVIKLRDHQIKSIDWMLKREKLLSSNIVFTPLYSCYDVQDKQFYAHIMDGYAVAVDDVDDIRDQQLPLLGGILADEMGLGKTMCVLLTSLLNPCSPSFIDNSEEKLQILQPFESRKRKLSDDYDEPDEEPEVKKKVTEIQKNKENELTTSSVSLACICMEDCGKDPLRKNKRNRVVLTCIQCSRGIHQNCYLMNDDTKQPFICPFCEQRINNKVITSPATLIVAPQAILSQWIAEIQKHIESDISYYIYTGVNSLPAPDIKYLTKQDFIFCTYENLRKDIHHDETCIKELRSTRHAAKGGHSRRYDYLVSPFIKFWRLCLDEAQMVDTPNTPVSKMAKQLQAHHRWFVTGTPFSRSTNDLVGIIQYLFPNSLKALNQISFIVRNQHRISDIFLAWTLHLLLPITRRTSRDYLNDLPTQHEHIVNLQFSELERIYYNDVWTNCREEFIGAFRGLWLKRERARQKPGEQLNTTPSWLTMASDKDDIDMNDIRFLSSSARSALYTPLLKLRQVCCNPSIGAHGVRHTDATLVHYYNRFHRNGLAGGWVWRTRNPELKPLTTTEKNADGSSKVFTMNDLLTLLIAKEFEAGEDALRLALLNMNALAAMYLIQYFHEEARPDYMEDEKKSSQYYLQLAVDTYNNVMKTANEYKQCFHSDSFQQAHALYNLQQCLQLDSAVASSAATTSTITRLASVISCDEAKEQFDKIKKRYHSQANNELDKSWDEYNEKLIPLNDVKNEFEKILQSITDVIRPALHGQEIDIHDIGREKRFTFRTWDGFLLYIVENFKRVQEIRLNVVNELESIARDPTDEQVAEYARCSSCMGRVEEQTIITDNMGFEKRQQRQHKRDEDKTDGPTCVFCQCEALLNSYNISLHPELYSAKHIQENDGILLVHYINEILSKGSLRSVDATRQLAKILRTEWTNVLKKLRIENDFGRKYQQQTRILYASLDEMRMCTLRLELWLDTKHRPAKTERNRYLYNVDEIEIERIEHQQKSKEYLTNVAKRRQQFRFFQGQQDDYFRSIQALSDSRVDSKMDTDDVSKCGVCHELFSDELCDVCFFLCGHVYCRACTLQWKSRRDIPTASLTVIKWKDKNTVAPKITTTPVKTIMDKNTSFASIATPRSRRLLEAKQHLSVHERYGSKVDGIVTFIVNLLNNENVDDNTAATTATATTTTMTAEEQPPLKILVFSQWNDILSIIGTSLRSNAVSFLHFDSTIALEEFRNNPTISILLMPLSRGANGLNLTEATHVILAEPSMNRSVELQAIARVQRLGQKYQTYVWRFIIDDTVEETVIANSRTAQTMAITTTQSKEKSDSNLSTSFQDFELSYEINIARKIFFKSSHPLNDLPLLDNTS